MVISETKNEPFTHSSTSKLYCHKYLIKSFVSLCKFVRLCTHFTCSRLHKPINNNHSRVDFVYVFYIHINILCRNNRRPTTTRFTTRYNTFKCARWNKKLEKDCKKYHIINNSRSITSFPFKITFHLKFFYRMCFGIEHIFI